MFCFMNVRALLLTVIEHEHSEQNSQKDNRNRNTNNTIAEQNSQTHNRNRNSILAVITPHTSPPQHNYSLLQDVSHSCKTKVRAEHVEWNRCYSWWTSLSVPRTKTFQFGGVVFGWVAVLFAVVGTWDCGHGDCLHSCVSLVGPAHNFPPYDGSGLLQTRVRLILPEPHVTEQALNGDQSENPPSTGHGLILQLWVSSVIPSHGFPPDAGAGLSQSRTLFCTPPPHVLSHKLNKLQSPNCPSTGQTDEKHGLVSLSDPRCEHLEPKIPGTGLSHRRILNRVPLPHWCEQFPQANQSE